MCSLERFILDNFLAKESPNLHSTTVKANSCHIAYPKVQKNDSVKVDFKKTAPFASLLILKISLIMNRKI